MNFYVYHHNDFDGLAGAAIFAKFLSREQKIHFDDFKFQSVDYNLKSRWMDFRIENPSVIIDFLYHSKADWWFDHHSSTFVTKADLVRPYKRSEKQYWNTKFYSCPSLIVSHLWKYFRSQSIYLKNNYKDLIHWSDIIDGARYESPSDLFGFENHYLNINKTLALNSDAKYFRVIIEAFFADNLDIILNNPIFENLIEKAKQKEAEAIETITRIIEVDGTIAYFDQSDYKIPFQRYLSYHLFPETDYRVAIYKKNGGYSVSVNYNNWQLEKNKINLGLICSRLGGGGKLDVGAVLTNNRQEAQRVALTLKNALSQLTAEQLKFF